MYETFYGLKEKPFKVLPDPDYLYMSPGHQKAYTHLEYGILENKGFVVITGEVGSGKTTLINYLLNKIPQDIRVGLINNTHIPPDQLLKAICQDFELDVGETDKAGMVDLFHTFLIDAFVRNHRVVLIVDEAQNLTDKALEEIRMLSNLETEKHHLIQIVLVGQPELRHKLRKKNLRQFVQRVTVHCHLEGLKADEVDRYIRYRLEVGGAGTADLFDKAAVSAVCKYSHGIPRLINILCDTALVYGYADGLKAITGDVVENVIQERKAGGIFSGLPEDYEEPVVHHETGLCAPVMAQFRTLERKIRLLENTVADLERRLEMLEAGDRCNST
ncbi:general secretion pathway protein [Desulfonema ishimotonii]|uniref:General secretion pathway protein n=1 Tax=Desulfonema ishimotonii TaxID=45657 RepID=A0A401FVB9_9BACT|nr:AAA family ATPase [Desulfonema ishimotonii]GBC60910.1 general secretion pathway protein [Desulfonema ishimotonii]